MAKECEMAEMELEGISESVVSGMPLNGSSTKRIEYWVRSRECAIIAAFRRVDPDIADGTFRPKRLRNGPSANPHKDESGKTKTGEYESGDEFVEGDAFASKERRDDNRKLLAKLLDLGYGVAKIRGAYREGGIAKETGDDQEERFFAANLNDDPDFKNKIFEISEYFNQDSFLYSPVGSDDAFLVGTNSNGFPGYGNELKSGKLHAYVSSQFMSRIGNAGFSFGDDGDMRPDDRPTFLDRKGQRIGKPRIERHRRLAKQIALSNRELDECLDTKRNHGVLGMMAIHLAATDD